MRKHVTARHIPEHLLAWENRHVTLAGEIAAVAVENDEDDRKIDHVWIEVRAGEFGRLQIALSTCSRQNRAAGFDPRVRVGLIETRWVRLPPAGVRHARLLDYAELEAIHRVDYHAYTRPELEEFLVEKAHRAIFVEAWGESMSARTSAFIKFTAAGQALPFREMRSAATARDGFIWARRMSRRCCCLNSRGKRNGSYPVVAISSKVNCARLSSAPVLCLWC
ncbi:MAG: hypothetical protein H0X73_04865 [Chthoniobacterales bacterium]|nr:hypothetical protein [Chthoniobacterales bacterium]